MRKYYLIMLLLLSVAILCAGETFPIPALPYEPLSYVCNRSSADITVDGKLTDSAWQQATWSTDFVDIEGSLKPLPYFQTRFKMLWSDQGLYIGAELIEQHIWAKLTKRDAVIFFDNDFEVFIDPDGDTHDYYELEMNAYANLWDLLCIKPYRDRQQVAVNAWDIKNIQLAVNIDGTLNKPTDKDSKWSLELLIPWDVLSECAHRTCPPVSGDYWRMNFSRVQWETEVINGKYEKKKDPASGNNLAEHNWVWSPQGLIAMHYPERWGYVFFNDAKAPNAISSMSIPPSETAKEYLRQLYYKQKQYWFDHQSYSKTLEELDMPEFTWVGQIVPLKLETTSLSYIVTLSATPDFKELHIREDGLTW